MHCYKFFDKAALSEIFNEYLSPLFFYSSYLVLCKSLK
jgi:hypothetical protein